MSLPGDIKLKYLNNFFKKFKDILFFFICYLLSYFFQLTNNGIYWDDWTLFLTNTKTRIKFIMDLGIGPIGFICETLLMLPYAFLLGRIVSFFSYFLAGICLNEILKTIRGIDKFSRIILVTLFLVFPSNCGRIAFCVTHYAVCYFLFFFGFFLLSKYLQNKNIFFRILSIISFYIAFFTNSFLVFYLLIIIYLFYHERKILKSVKDIIGLILKYLDIFLLPLIFWVIKIIYFQPKGIMQGHYNQITIANLLDIFQNFILAFRTSFIQIIKRAVILGINNILLIIILTIILFVILKIMNLENKEIKKRYAILGIIFGFFCFFLAVFPYLITLNIPLNQGWLSRHQLLIPLGASLMIFYSFQLIFYFLKFKNLKLIVISFIISLFIFVNVNTFMEYYKDWFKQLSLIENLKINNEIEKGEIFSFFDNAYFINAKQRELNLYEYMGIFKYSFPEAKLKYVFPYDDFPNVEKKYSQNFQYFFIKKIDFTNVNKPEYIIYIRQRNLKIDRKIFLELFFLYYIDDIKFKNKIINYIYLDVQKI